MWRRLAAFGVAADDWLLAMSPEQARVKLLFNLFMLINFLKNFDVRKTSYLARSMLGLLRDPPKQYPTHPTHFANLHDREDPGDGCFPQVTRFPVSWSAIVDRPKQENGATYSVFRFTFSFNSGLFLGCYEWTSTCCHLAWHG